MLTDQDYPAAVELLGQIAACKGRRPTPQLHPEAASPRAEIKWVGMEGEEDGPLNLVSQAAVVEAAKARTPSVSWLSISVSRASRA